MKYTGKRIAALLLILVLALTLAGCNRTEDWQTMLDSAEKLGELAEDESLRQSTQQMMGCLIADDFDGAYALISSAVTKEQFQPLYDGLRPILQEVEGYELIASYKATKVTDGTSYVAVRYLFVAQDLKLVVEATRQEGVDGLIGFRVNEYQEVTVTGTVGSMKGANAAQWVFLVIAIAETGFVIWMFVDCCRRKIRRKWLWLLLVALVSVALSISVGGGFRFHMNVGLFLNLYTALLRYNTGEITLRLMVPLGAVLYLCLRKNLVKQTQEASVQEVPTQEEPAQEEPAQSDEEPEMQ